VNACDGCLRRSALLGLLAPYIARSLQEHRRLPALLALADEELIAAVSGRRRPRVDDRIARFDPQAARGAAERTGLAIVCRHDSSFPGALREGADAPAMLYVAGDRRLLRQVESEAAVAVVGARRASPYGLEVAHALSRELASSGVPVVSGMARGADAAAHEGALAGGGLTVAVLPGGADVPYPRSQRRLFERIGASGLLLSELPPGSKPFRWSFPARNRIMAGLCAMTVVVEGSRSSGSLITARFASDLGREVGAVPGQVVSTLAAGPNALLADGACVVRSADDVLDAVHGVGARRERAERRIQDLDPALAELLAVIERGEGSIDSLAGDPSEIPALLAALTELELSGLVRREAGGRYVRCL
jgi:DNA processing protein